MNKAYYYSLFLTLLISCQSSSNENDNLLESQTQKIALTLDSWHDAAARADFDTYFDLFESDSAIFMGTDATERWTVAEFKPWSKPFFDRGRAWSFTANSRYITLAEDGMTAWFDEALDTPNMGPCRGSGVMKLTNNGWKIAHYNLSLTVPNEAMDEVKKVIDGLSNSQ